MIDLVKLIIKKSSWSYYVLVINIFSGILHTGFLTRALGVSEFGKYHVLLAFSAIIIGLFSFLGSEALIPYVTKYKNNGDNENLIRTIKSTISLIYFTSILGFVFFLIVLCLKPNWTGIGENEIILGLLIGCTGVSAANIYSYMNILRVFNNFSIYLKQALIFDTFKVLIAATLYYFHFGLIYYVTAILIRQVFQTLYYDFHTRRMISIHLGYNIKSLLTKRLIINAEEKSYFYFNFFSTQLRSFSLHFDKVLINILLKSTSVVGLFAIAKQISQLSELAFSNLSTAIIPQMASDFFSDKKNLKKNIFIQTGLIMVIGFPIIGSMLLFTDNIIVLWTGAEYLSAAPIVRILLIGVLIRITFYVINQLPASIGNAKVKFLGGFFGLICWLSIILLSYKEFGVLSFAYGMVGGTIGSSSLMLFYSIKIIKNVNS